MPVQAFSFPPVPGTVAQQRVCQLLRTGDLVQDVVIDLFRLFNRSLMQISFAHV